jgi:hypothetical protein
MRTNSAKERFLKSFPDLFIADHIDRLNNNIAFNFQYFDISQEPSSDFSSLSEEQLKKLVTKLRGYTCETIEHWKREPIKGCRCVLEVYGTFPKKSDFCHPKMVPSDVEWARFRLEGDMRLIGFILPDIAIKTYNLVKNVFYVVFIDENHRFYKG